MNAKPVLRRKSARIDIEVAADHYEQEAGQDVALRFADAVEAAFRVIGERPGTGSSLWAERLGIAGLRSRAVARFPYLIFYSEHEEHVEVWRVLHARRDIPATLGGEDS